MDLLNDVTLWSWPAEAQEHLLRTSPALGRHFQRRASPRKIVGFDVEGSRLSVASSEHSKVSRPSVQLHITGKPQLLQPLVVPYVPPESLRANINSSCSSLSGPPLRPQFFRRVEKTYPPSYRFGAPQPVVKAPSTDTTTATDSRRTNTSRTSTPLTARTSFSQRSCQFKKGSPAATGPPPISEASYSPTFSYDPRVLRSGTGGTPMFSHQNRHTSSHETHSQQRGIIDDSDYTPILATSSRDLSGRRSHVSVTGYEGGGEMSASGGETELDVSAGGVLPGSSRGTNVAEEVPTRGTSVESDWPGDLSEGVAVSEGVGASSGVEASEGVDASEGVEATYYSDVTPVHEVGADTQPHSESEVIGAIDGQGSEHYAFQGLDVITERSSEEVEGSAERGVSPASSESCSIRSMPKRNESETHSTRSVRSLHSQPSLASHRSGQGGM
eukprot:GHVN01032336.1.p1 GENE.GHVN01032336.1~~GHVN01032336.1.p1  ORF type:complete len:443 (+),score=71.31 GHVN01032336.1:128-1456(+)